MRTVQLNIYCLVSTCHCPKGNYFDASPKINISDGHLNFAEDVCKNCFLKNRQFVVDNGPEFFNIIALRTILIEIGAAHSEP